jgi:hypothetical protein
VNASKSNLDLGSLSLGIEIFSTKLGHEIEFIPVQMNQEDNLTSVTYLADQTEQEGILHAGLKTTSIHSSLVYHFRYYFLSHSGSRMQPCVGSSSKLFTDYQKSRPKTTETYTNSQFETRGALQFTPGITIGICKAISLIVDIPFSVARLKYVRDRIDNPLLPIAKRTKESIVTEMFPKVYQVKLGLGFKF